MCVFLLTDLGESILLRVLVLVLPSPPLGEEQVDEVCQQVGLKNACSIWSTWDQSLHDLQARKTQRGKKKMGWVYVKSKTVK